MLFFSAGFMIGTKVVECCHGLPVFVLNYANSFPLLPVFVLSAELGQPFRPGSSLCVKLG